MCCWCLSINDTLESIQSKLKIIVISAVILTIVLIVIKYWPETDSTGKLGAWTVATFVEKLSL